MQKQIVLTGIKPTGKPHLGNYVGAIRPALARAQESSISSYLFVADYHSLTSLTDSQNLKTWVHEVAATWLACGLDVKKTVFYCQSDIPELFELNWILSCFTPKGLMNRAHAYKEKQDENKKYGRAHLDDGVNMGLYSYPVLMAADILLFSTDKVPVGEDQLQHLEIARDIARKINKKYQGEILTVPESLAQKQPLVLGIDGKKMSKSYNNDIPLFEESNKIRKLIMKIKTNSLDPKEPKNPKDCLIFGMYKHIASSQEIKNLEKQYQKGIGWGEAKEILFEKFVSHFKDQKQVYDHYMKHPQEVQKILKEGQQKAREHVQPLLKKIKKIVGVD